LGRQRPLGEAGGVAGLGNRDVDIVGPGDSLTGDVIAHDRADHRCSLVVSVDRCEFLEDADSGSPLTTFHLICHVAPRSIYQLIPSALMIREKKKHERIEDRVVRVGKNQTV
jgi:hypothetical protein